VIVGDLVFSQDNNNNGQHNQREVILIDDGNIHKYTIYDVVLPLPGSDIIYPANEDIDWYDDLFKAEGISERDFNLKSKYFVFLFYFYISFYMFFCYIYRTWGLVGGYRPMLLRPSDLKWKFVRYDHRRQNLFLSDLEQQLAGQPPVGSLPGM
jgi:tRNA pseudouridine13 synthase